jgi:hypothetical protein
VKTSELTGAALRWAVAKAEELDVYIPAYDETPWLQVRRDGIVFVCPHFEKDWEHGGPILDREGIAVRRVKDRTWRADFSDAVLNVDRSAYVYLQHQGPTPLIAAMRCYIASKLGNEADIPEELT